MKKRLMFLLLVVAGVWLLASQFPPHIDVMPLPTSTSIVRLKLPVRSAGDYHLKVSMPKIDNKLTLSEESFSCDILVSIEAGGYPVVSQHVTSIRTASEYGFANTQSFVGGENFQLRRGTYEVTITGGSACPVATTRGASVTIKRFETKHILGSLFILLLVIALILVGVTGLLLSEFVRRPNQPLNNDAPRRRAF